MNTPEIHSLEATNMDTHQPASKPVTYHADSRGGFYTTSLFWDCSCDDHYIHPYTEADYPACGDCRDHHFWRSRRIS
jgi:hypothetical protein